VPLAKIVLLVKKDVDQWAISWDRWGVESDGGTTMQGSKLSKADRVELGGAVHLQSVGLVKAKRADEFKIGEYMGWNFGSVTKVVAIRDVSKCYLEVDESLNGKVYTRKMKKDRLVAIGTA